MELLVLNGTYQLVRLSSDSPIPSEVFKQEFYTVSKTPDELSIIVSDSVHIESKDKDTDWKIIKFVESMDLSLVGITAKISAILAEQRINACYLATYNTDYVLIKRERLKTAVSALENSGYVFIKEYK